MNAMISMSRLRLVLCAAAVVAAASACDSRICSAIGCFDGLNIALDGRFETGTVYQFDMSDVTDTPGVAPFMRCSLVRPEANSWDLRCSSVFPHSEGFGNRVQVRTTEIKRLQVVVSSNGTMLGEQVLDVGYTSKEINGPGCGVCTSALVNVTIP